MTTPYHSQYWAHALTLRGATGSIEALSRSIAGSRVDLNPHQVDAALFAIRSPLTRGVILADEVGLGKTIEAGIVISQRWAERKRRILVIVPSTLRKQWQQDLETKFYLPTRVLDSRAFNALAQEGVSNAFDSPDRLVICSYHFASAKANEIHRVPWDLVVIDEAHRLRNVYKKASRLARRIADAVGSAPKLLLTATPLQNSLMELYGLASVIDDHLFGDATSFRDRFVRAADERGRNADLRARLQPICARTLRKQIVEHIPFTRRIPITQDFLPSDAEHELYEAISDYLQRDQLIALPASQRTLITLVLRKLLASSTFAIADTLDRLAMRLEAISSNLPALLAPRASRQAGDASYEPDFVVEAKAEKYLCEPKSAAEMEDRDVLAKAQAAVEWCSHATKHEAENGGKPWTYLLIPHDVITDNKTLKGLAASCTHRGKEQTGK
ncbi:MAG: DEAD/DEAH box helicase [Planctomycetes bacterium]|nr:DEAD/DEAH box helicase [Planctomycetota bacterium]